MHHVPVAPALGDALAILPDGGDRTARQTQLASHVALALAALDLLDDLHFLLDREREPLSTLRWWWVYRDAQYIIDRVNRQEDGRLATTCDRSLAADRRGSGRDGDTRRSLYAD